MNNFNIGDTVRLLSGGPKMTINKVSIRHEERIMSCIWFDDNNKPATQEFNEKTLEDGNAEVERQAEGYYDH